MLATSTRGPSKCRERRSGARQAEALRARRVRGLLAVALASSVGLLAYGRAAQPAGTTINDAPGKGNTLSAPALPLVPLADGDGGPAWQRAASDGTVDLADTWGVTGLPETFFLTADGNVAAHVTGAIDAEAFDSGIEAAVTGRAQPARSGGAQGGRE